MIPWIWAICPKRTKYKSRSTRDKLKRWELENLRWHYQRTNFLRTKTLISLRVSTLTRRYIHFMTWSSQNGSTNFQRRRDRCSKCKPRSSSSSAISKTKRISHQSMLSSREFMSSDFHFFESAKTRKENKLKCKSNQAEKLNLCPPIGFSGKRWFQSSRSTSLCLTRTAATKWCTTCGCNSRTTTS